MRRVQPSTNAQQGFAFDAGRKDSQVGQFVGHGKSKHNERWIRRRPVAQKQHVKQIAGALPIQCTCESLNRSVPA